MEPILIVGGGIAGLSAALALARTGRAVSVLERAPRFHEFGAGLQVSPNAAAVLSELGLGAELHRAASTPRSVVMSAGPSGRVVRRLDLETYCRRRRLEPYRVVHRADLIGLLADAAEADPLIALHRSAWAQEVAWDGARVLVTTKDGRSIAGCALVAADGVWSGMRTRALGLPPAAPSGRSAWRATVEASRVADIDAEAIGLVMGPDAHLVHYPLRHGALINLVAVVVDGFEEATWDGSARREALHAHFGAWSPRMRALLDKPDEWRRWPLYQRVPESYSIDRPIVLVGDAWHAALPFVAQGAAMAIEDAAVLARCMSAETSLLAAFRRFIAVRAPRTARLVRLAERNGRIYHMSGPMAFARDAALKALTSERLLSSLDWIYRWKPAATA